MFNLRPGDRWRCPYCGTNTFVTKESISESTIQVNTRSKRGHVGLRVESVACANSDCRELSINVQFGDVALQRSTTGTYLQMQLDRFERALLPEARLVTLPTDVPEEIAITYREAVLVAEVSGRASAAMARRCLQGIVRDFFNIPNNKRGNLGAELSYVRSSIDPELWEAIQAVRGVGDIGAHMDQNVDHIIDITHDEAKLLIGLIETLFKEWYEARGTRRTATAALRELLGDKRDQQKQAKKNATQDSPEVSDSEDSLTTE